jgi:outer membrane protein W
MASVSASGQAYNNLFSIGLDFNQPISNTDFIGNTSTRGFKFGYRKAINERFLAGVDLSTATYHDYAARETYTSATGALTTDFYKYAYTYGLTLSGNYLFFPESKIQPYGGLGIGASYIDYTQYYNIFSSSDPRWGVLVRPEAGVFVRLGKYSSWGIHGAVHYDFSSAKSTDFDYRNFSNAGFQIGLVFFSW